MTVRLPSALLVLSSVLVSVACGEGAPTDPLGPVSIETESLPEAVEGREYGQQLEAAGGSGSYTWAVAGGSLPAGLTLAPAGRISGTPLGAGTATFRVRATDADGAAGTADLSLSVVQALAVHTAILAEGVAGEVYAAQLQAVGGRGARVWSVTGGDAASWLTVSSEGALSGTPPASGSFTLTVSVTDESGQEASRPFPLVVLDPVAVAEPSLPVATQGRVYAAQLVATGGDGFYAWSVDGGALPTGMALASAGGLTGTPEDAGSFSFTARVRDGADRTATRSITLVVERAPTIRTATLPPGEVGVAYAARLEATGGTGAYTWSLADGALPDGLTLSGSGEISGTPTALGSATFTVRVTDEASATHTRPFTVVVADVEELANGVPATELAGEAGSARYYVVDVPEGATRLIVSLSGGTGDADLYVRHGTLPENYVYDCRPLRQGNDETCTFTSPAAGPWYVMVRGHTAYSDASLTAAQEE